MFLGQEKTKKHAIKNAILMNFLMQPLMDIVQLSSHMDRLVQERPIRWLEKIKFLREKSTSKTKDRGSFLEQFRNCGRRFEKKRAIIQSKHLSQKYITNRSRTY